MLTVLAHAERLLNEITSVKELMRRASEVLTDEHALPSELKELHDIYEYVWISCRHVIPKI